MIYRNCLSLILAFSILTTILPTIGYAQSTSSDYSKELSTIEQKIEKRRRELLDKGLKMPVPEVKAGILPQPQIDLKAY